MSTCKENKKLYDKEYRKRNKEKLREQKKEWVKNNPDKVKESRVRNKESKKLSDKKYSIRNKEKLNEYKKEWAKNNPDKVKESNFKYHQNKMINDKLYKLKHLTSNIIRDSFKRKGISKNYRSVYILGCTIDFFKNYLENKFESWMNWDNYGNPIDGLIEPNKTWDIDHIIPLSNATTEEEIFKLNHYTNLQPLCSYHNRFIKKDN